MTTSTLIPRQLQSALESRLSRRPAVVLLGSRQVGKTTLARIIASQQGGIYLDLENPQDIAKIEDISAFCRMYEQNLLIFDEIQRAPDLFAPLRSIIDSRQDPQFPSRRRPGQFLMLGSAALDLQLAGRISYFELHPLTLSEVGAENLHRLWLRGGYPDSYLADNNMHSLEWRTDLVRSYLERDLPAYGLRATDRQLRNFWTMLAHCQCQPLILDTLARSLALSGATVRHYLDMFAKLLLVRTIPAWHKNMGKRLTKSAKVYIRDSGLCHQLLGIGSIDDLLGHPIAGHSWEGFVLEHIVRALPDNATYSYYRTGHGAEADLVIEFADGALWCVDAKLSTAPTVERGFYQVCHDLKPSRALVVHGKAQSDRFPLKHGVEAVSLGDVLADLDSLRLHAH